MEKVLNFVGWIAGHTSERLLDFAARFLTFLAYDLFRLRRKLILKNLRIAFGDQYSEKELVKVGRESVYNFACTAFEFFHGYGNDIAENCQFENSEILKKALDEGQGVYILCFHMGNWEAMGARINRSIAPAHVLVKKVGHGGVNDFVEKQRARSGFLAVKRKKKGDGYAAIKKILSNNEIVGFVMDQARRGEPKLPFFGHDATTNTSLAAIWRRHPAPIIPSYANREGFNRHTIKFFPEVKLSTTDDKEQDVLDHSVLFNQVIEEHVRGNKEQYFWLHNRWK